MKKLEREWEERNKQSPLKVMIPFLLALLALLAWGMFAS
jgi:hypothetical protein